MKVKYEFFTTLPEKNEIQLREIARSTGFELHSTDETATIHFINIPIPKCVTENGELKVIFQNPEPKKDIKGEKFIFEGPVENYRRLNRTLCLYDFEELHPIITIRPAVTTK